MSSRALELIRAAPAESAGFLTSILFRPSYSVDEVVLENFLESVNGPSGDLEEVIHQAEMSLMLLGKLKVIVRAIHTTATTADKTLKVKQDDLLSTLWSRIGFNMRDKRVFKNNFELLKHLYAYHDIAKKHVEAALLALRSMDNGMKELQTSVRKPGHHNSSSIIPAEVHVRSLTIGLERLQAGKAIAKRNQRGFREIIEHLSING
jgi:hypothetical protein